MFVCETETVIVIVRLYTVDATEFIFSISVVYFFGFVGNGAEQDNVFYTRGLLFEVKGKCPPSLMMDGILQCYNIDMLLYSSIFFFFKHQYQVCPPR